MAFVPRYPELANEFKTALIANSEAVITVGDLIIPGSTATQVIGAKNTTGRILGVVKSILKAGTYSGLNSIAVASDNVTNAQYGVEYIPAYANIEYLADLSQASGTTSGSAGMGLFNLSTTLNGTLDETSYQIYSYVTQLQFFSFGVDASSTSKVVGKFTAAKAIL